MDIYTVMLLKVCGNIHFSQQRKEPELLHNPSRSQDLLLMENAGRKTRKSKAGKGIHERKRNKMLSIFLTQRIGSLLGEQSRC